MDMGSLEDPEKLGRLLAASGYFSDATDAAQAVVKVLAGAELGFGPIASMTGVYIVKGRVTLSANLMAAAIQRHPRYDFKPKTKTNDRTHAEIEFFRDGKTLGVVEFTIQDAQTAKLTGGENWQKYPANMLYWRALSNGAKMLCAEVFAGAPIYTPDELGAPGQLDPESGEFIEAVGTLTTRTATPPQYDEPLTREDVSAMARASTPPVDGQDPEYPPDPEPEPAPAPAPEPEPAAAPEAANGKDPNAPLTEAEAEALTAYLHRIETPEAMWRMALMSHGADRLEDLTQGQAHDLMVKARQRYGAAPKA